MKLRNVILAGLMFGMAHGMNVQAGEDKITKGYKTCLLYTSPSPRD